jgi:hypothetical protein
VVGTDGVEAARDGLTDVVEADQVTFVRSCGLTVPGTGERVAGDSSGSILEGTGRDHGDTARASKATWETPGQRR